MGKSIFLKSGFSFDRLHSFCLVAKAESFTKAAEGDANRQTLYSRQVKDLERFFETELFQRKGRTVTLTDSGKELLLLASEYISALEDFHERCSGELGSFTIGAGESIIQWTLIPKLKEIKKVFGKADMAFKNLRTKDILDGLRRGDVDFGIVRKSEAISEFESLPFGKLRFALFYPSEKGNKKLNEIAILSNYPLATMEGEGSYQDFLSGLETKHKTYFKRAVSCSSFPSMVKALKALKMAAILPEMARQDLAALGFDMKLSRQFDPLNRDLQLCWNKRLAKISPVLGELGLNLRQAVCESMP